MLRKGKRRVIKEILFFKDSKSIASTKNKLFLKKRIIMQGLIYNYICKNK